MEYRATVTIEVHVRAPDEHSAHVAVERITDKLPQGCTLMNPPEIALREIRSVDRRMKTHVPNLPSERVTGMILAMTPDQQLAVQLCVRPQWGHTVYTALRKVFPDVPIETFVAHITKLRSDGWLETYSGAV